MKSIKKATLGEKSEIFLSDQLIDLEKQVSFQSHPFSSKKLLINVLLMSVPDPSEGDMLRDKSGETPEWHWDTIWDTIFRDTCSK